MRLIAGLGNPGPRYAESRHNVGYLVVDELARRCATEVTRYDRRFQGLVGQANRGAEVVLLLKPSTYMNLSGQSVSAVWRYYKLATSEVLVIHDDLDLALGQVRLRPAGSAGGHKGLSDVLRHFKTDEVARLRIGIGKVHRDATVEYVLGRFESDELPEMEAAVATAADAAECWLTSGTETAMNKFNRRRDVESPPRRSAGDSASEGESS